ncbi:MAG: hypothetical protein GY927_12300 [bacterium]|nr:hypothetical protein [bacterium]
MVMTNIQQYFPNPTQESVFFAKTASTLANLGFRGENTLPIIAVCRDEICASFVSAAEQHWGNSFTLGGLAGLPFAGKTGMGAASHHAPDKYDRERFVIYAMTHIGFGPDAEIGGCVRPGMEHLNGACGALMAYTGQLKENNVETKVFTDDGEFGLLTHRLAKVAPTDNPDLIGVTSAALKAIRQDIDGLATSVIDTEKADYAVFTGTQVHLPDGNYVQAADSWVVMNGQRQDINFNS